MLDEQANRVEADLTGLVETAAAALVDLPGVGVHTAAELLMAAGDNADRIRSEAAFAHLCGAAPIPASSGKTSRHRLNYAGNRAANHALAFPRPTGQPSRSFLTGPRLLELHR